MLQAGIRRLGGTEWLRARTAEATLVLFGMALRVSMLWWYDVGVGYDFMAHEPYVKWFVKQWALPFSQWHLPPLMLCAETYHPPLYYVIAGGFLAFAHRPSLMGLPSVVFACATLLLAWWAFERYLPRQRVARCAGLGLFAVLPASIHLSGMMSGEGLNNLLSLLAVVIAAQRLRQPLQRPFTVAALLGLVLGPGMLTKISTLMIIAAIFLAAGADFSWSRDLLSVRAKHVAPWLLTLAVLFGTSGWYFARNHRLYGKTVLMGYDGKVGAPPAEIERTPYLDRRTLGFYLSWSKDVFKFPYYPSAVTPRARFWPVLVTSTFVDYYNYSFVAAPRKSTLKANGRNLPEGSLKFARASAVGGALIALTTAVAWVACGRELLRRRDAALLLFWILPVMGLIGQLHFATRYPVDTEGPIKGVYMQFVSVPLFGFFGVAVAWMVRRRWTLLLALEGVAWTLVAIYVLYARVTG